MFDPSSVSLQCGTSSAVSKRNPPIAVPPAGSATNGPRDAPPTTPSPSRSRTSTQGPHSTNISPRSAPPTTPSPSGRRRRAYRRRSSGDSGARTRGRRFLVGERRIVGIDLVARKSRSDHRSATRARSRGTSRLREARTRRSIARRRRRRGSPRCGSGPRIVRRRAGARPGTPNEHDHQITGVLAVDAVPVDVPRSTGRHLAVHHAAATDRLGHRITSPVPQPSLNASTARPRRSRVGGGAIGRRPAPDAPPSASATRVDPRFRTAERIVRRTNSQPHVPRCGPSWTSSSPLLGARRPRTVLGHSTQNRPGSMQQSRRPRTRSQHWGWRQSTSNAARSSSLDRTSGRSCRSPARARG